MTGPIVVAEGSNVTLTCEASDDDDTQNYRYHWKKGTKLLPRNDGRYNTERRGRDFTIYNVSVNDSGQYHCEFNINGESIPSFKVQVLVKSGLLTCRNMFDIPHVYRETKNH